MSMCVVCVGAKAFRYWPPDTNFGQPCLMPVQAPACRLGLDGISVLSQVWGRPGRLSHTRKVTTAEQCASDWEREQRQCYPRSWLARYTGNRWSLEGRVLRRHLAVLGVASGRVPRQAWTEMVSGRRREEGFSPPSSQPSLVSGTLDPAGLHGQLVCGGSVRRFAVENNQETGFVEREVKKPKPRRKWRASKTPPVDGRTSREEVKTMENEPERDMEPRGWWESSRLRCSCVQFGRDESR